jgi:heme/copper-type cytochrome/quinol oxidase subunit 2
MPIVVEVLSKEDYAAWLAAQKTARAPADAAPADATAETPAQASVFAAAMPRG